MINVNVPLNSVSFGFVGYNLLKKAFEKNLDVNLFPIGKVDLSSFDKMSQEFADWLSSAARIACFRYKRSDPGFKLWHIKGSEESCSNEQFLLTFYELDKPTQPELNILSQQKRVFFSSEYTATVFKAQGLSNVDYVPLGFDSEHFRRVEKHPYNNEITVGLLCGKWELRKQTAKAVKTWLKKFGNNKKHMLHLSIYNQFFTPEQNKQFLMSCFGGQNYFNVNVLPYYKTLSEFNAVLNSCDYVIDMSGGEAWSIPSFSAVAMGKHGIVHHVNGVKSWANEENCVLIDPIMKAPLIDNVFFREGDVFNNGSIFVWDEQEFLDKLDVVLNRVSNNPINEAGLRLQEEFTWEKSYNKIFGDFEERAGETV